MLRKEGEGERGIIKIRAAQCFNRWPREGGQDDPPGAREMSADETKEGGQMQQCRARD